MTACRPNAVQYEQLQTAQAQMDTQPDSALSTLRRIDPKGLRTKAWRARHALLYSQALDKNQIDLQSDSIIAPAVSYYKRHGNARDKAYTNYYLGCIRYNAGEIEQGVEAMLNAKGFAIAESDSYLLARIYGSLGRMYQDQHSFDTAEKMFLESEKYFRELSDTLNLGYMILNRAIIYSSTDKSIDAIKGFMDAKEQFRLLGDVSKVSEMNRNIINEQNATTYAIPDSLKSLLIREYKQVNQGKIPPEDYSMWAAIYLNERKLDSARYFGEKALTLPNIMPNKKCGMLLRMCQINEQCGNYQEANKYWHYYYVLYETIVQATKTQLIQEAEKNYENQRLQYSNQLLRIKNRIIHVIWALLFLTGCILLISYFTRLLHRYRLFIHLLKDNIGAFRKQCLRLHQELNQESIEEANLIKILEEKLVCFQNLLSKAYSNQKAPSFLKEFRNAMSALNQRSKPQADLLFVVNKRYYGLIDYLRATYPDLTIFELNLLGMIQFGFTQDSIRLLLDHDNIYSLYSRKNKVHRKLGLPQRYTLDKFLTDLTEKLRKGELKAPKSIEYQPIKNHHIKFSTKKKKA